MQAGIARTFQNVRLFQQLSAIENVLAGRHCRTRSGLLGALLRLRQVREEREAVARAVDELAFVGLRGRAMELATNLSYGDQRREIARALAADRSCSSSTSRPGHERAGDRRAHRAHRQDPGPGITILLIEHDMSLVMRACEHIVVLEYGEKIARGPASIQANPRVIEAYLGTEEV